MRDYSISSKAGKESSPQFVPRQQDKETTATRQGKATPTAPIGFDFGKMPVTPPERQHPDLPLDLQMNMESSFGQDFSGVDIHRNSQQAQHMNALAYTQGESIHFAPGEFNPHSERGRNLIGHEFAHIVQQRSGVVQPTAVLGKGLEINDNQGLENEADTLGRKAVQGEAVREYQSPSLGMKINDPIQRKDNEKSSALSKDIKLTIAVDKQADYLSKEYLDEAAVGHSWIMLQKPMGIEDSFGFWPANLGSGGGFNLKEFWKDVEGEVRHPDTSHTPNAKYSVQIDSNQLLEGEKYAVDKAKAKYNLLWYNCTTFARDFFEKSSGKSAPSAGLLIEDPNALYESIEMINGAKGLDPNKNKKTSKKAK